LLFGCGEVVVSNVVAGEGEVHGNLVDVIPLRELGGRCALRLLRRIAAQAARTSSFPSPQDYSSWSDDAVDVVRR